MDPKDILEQARDVLTARRVFGEPIERDGLLVVPVAAIRSAGGAGGGDGRSAEGAHAGSGSGGGWAGSARPVGVYVIAGGSVRWRPAIDVNRAILGGQVVVVIGLLVVRSILRSRRRG